MRSLTGPFHRLELWRIERHLRRDDPAFARLLDSWSASEPEPPVIGCPRTWRQSRWRAPFALLAAAACLVGLGAAWTLAPLLVAGMVTAVAAAALLRLAADRTVTPAEPAPPRQGHLPPPRPAAPPRGVMG